MHYDWYETDSFRKQTNPMSMKTKAAILVTSFAVLLFVIVGSLGGVHAASNDGSYRQLQVYSEVLSRVRSEYVEEPNIPKVTDGALHGLLESLDSNSAYMTPEAYKAFKAHKSDAKAEIGAVFSKRFGYADVVAVLPGSPAEKAGLQQRDVIRSFNGRAVPDKVFLRSRVAEAEINSKVQLTVVRDGQEMTLTAEIAEAPTGVESKATPLPR